MNNRISQFVLRHLKYLFIAQILLFIQTKSIGQNNPVKFEYQLTKISINEYRLKINAQIQKGWHIYSQLQPSGATSIPTSVSIAKSPIVQLAGPVEEQGKMQHQLVKVLDIEQNIYEGTVLFIVPLILKASVKTSLIGSITYQACTDKACERPKTEPFNIPIY